MQPELNKFQGNAWYNKNTKKRRFYGYERRTN
jgi:hypothetical protein